MTALQAICFGLIQGLTELLPVSSSAHLILLPWVFRWPDPGLAFDVSLHIGTLVAVLAYFYRDVIRLTRDFFGALQGQREPQHQLPLKLIVATVPGALIGLAFEKQAETLFRSPLLIAGSLTALGLLLFFADNNKRERSDLTHLSWMQAILIGLSQGLAIIPGVSRSGITISVALLLGLEREAAVRFSFYLSIPIICGAGLLKSHVFLTHSGDPLFWMGLLTAAVSGYAAIRFLMNFVKTKSFTPFVVYRVLLSLFILSYYFLK